VACFTSTLLSLLFGAIMPIVLWEKEELKQIQSSRRSIKARLKRMVLALVVAGVGLAYVDLSARATIQDFLMSVKDQIGI